jgi:hypothetical protein
MKPWNKPIRISKREHVLRLKIHDERFGEDNRHYGVTNWMVGTSQFPWSPWVQIHIGYWSIQIKWYLIALTAIIGAFVLGVSL